MSAIKTAGETHRGLKRAAFCLSLPCKLHGNLSPVPKLSVCPCCPDDFPDGSLAPCHIRPHSVCWASLQKAPDKIAGGDTQAVTPPESGCTGFSAAGRLFFGWDGLMGISLMDSDPWLSHGAAQFPWSLDLVGLDLGPRVLLVPELMSQNIICWCIDCVRSW